MGSSPQATYVHSQVVLIGDSGVGKSYVVVCLLPNARDVDDFAVIVRCNPGLTRLLLSVSHHQQYLSIFTNRSSFAIHPQRVQPRLKVNHWR